MSSSVKGDLEDKSKSWATIWIPGGGDKKVTEVTLLVLASCWLSLRPSLVPSLLR